MFFSILGKFNKERVLDDAFFTVKKLFLYGADAAQPPEIDSKFVEKTVISTKYGGL